MRELLPQLLAAVAEASSVSDEAFKRVNPLVDQLEVLDTKIGTAATMLDEDEDEARRRITETKEDALSLMSRTLDEIRTVLRSLAP
jgi:ABC-type transporter Mla subunit MlaD